MLHLIWVLIIGAVIGSVAGWLTNRRRYPCPDRFTCFKTFD